LTWGANQLCDFFSVQQLPQSPILGLGAAIYFSSTDGFIKAILLILKKIQVVAKYSFKMQIRLCRWHKITAGLKNHDEGWN
jgi:hypothetical protein